MCVDVSYSLIHWPTSSRILQRNTGLRWVGRKVLLFVFHWSIMWCVSVLERRFNKNFCSHLVGHRYNGSIVIRNFYFWRIRICLKQTNSIYKHWCTSNRLKLNWIKLMYGYLGFILKYDRINSRYNNSMKKKTCLKPYKCFLRVDIKFFLCLLFFLFSFVHRNLKYFCDLCYCLFIVVKRLEFIFTEK